MDISGNGWDKYQLLVLQELNDLKEGQSRLEQKVEAVVIDSAVLQTTLKRDTKWISIISGAVTFIVTSIAAWLIKWK